MWAALIASGLVGTLIAVQSRINGGLGQVLENGYLAAAISFGVGFVILLPLTFILPSGRRGLRRLSTEVRSRRLPFWVLLGGLCGAFFVLGQGLIATVLGVALFTVGVVAGQVLGGLVMDRMGLGPGGRIDPTPQRVVGTGLAILAIVISVISVPGGGGSGVALWLVVLPFLAGIGLSWQSAVNGLMRAAARSTTVATMVSFAAGLLLLLIVAGVSVALQGWPERWPTDPVLYVGGVMGIVFVAVITYLVRIAGVLLLGMSSVAGQLVAAVALEAGLPLASGVTPWMLAGTAVALLAVALAALPSRSGAPSR